VLLSVFCLFCLYIGYQAYDKTIIGLLTIFRDLPTIELILTTIFRYVKALTLRQALEALDPRPNDVTLSRAAELYLHLVKAKRMYSCFDPRFDSAVANDDGCIPEFNPGAIYMANMETGPSSVPLFLRFFRRRSTPKSCIVCGKDKFDIDYTDEEAWKAECKAFKGSWMWDILVFPSREIQYCDQHSDFDVCRSCTTDYSESTLTNGGLAACENVRCPQCNRRLSYDEVRQLADAGTFTKYDPKPRSKLSLMICSSSLLVPRPLSIMDTNHFSKSSLVTLPQEREMSSAECAGEGAKLP